MFVVKFKQVRIGQKLGKNDRFLSYFRLFLKNFCAYLTNKSIRKVKVVV